MPCVRKNQKLGDSSFIGGVCITPSLFGLDKSRGSASSNAETLTTNRDDIFWSDNHFIAGAISSSFRMVFVSKPIAADIFSISGSPSSVSILLPCEYCLSLHWESEIDL